MKEVFLQIGIVWGAVLTIILLIVLAYPWLVKYTEWVAAL